MLAPIVAEPRRSRPGRRLQRPRTKGYRTPPGIFYAGRHSLLANPFTRERFGHARSVKLHARWLQGRLGAMTLERLGFDPAEIDALERLRARVLAFLPSLRGCDIQCWCPLTSRWCHVDTILRAIGRLVDAPAPPP